MKNIFLWSILILSFFSSLLETHGYSSYSASKAQIDTIHCDANFTSTMRQGKGYKFNDSFTTKGAKPVKVTDVKVVIYEDGDLNMSPALPTFSFTPRFVAKNNILNKTDSGMIIEADDFYNIKKAPATQNAENVKVVYTAEYFYHSGGDKFENGPHYHTECIDYSISWCGDSKISDGEVCDPNDATQKNWGTGGCSPKTCQPVNKVVQLPGSCNSFKLAATQGVEKLTTAVMCSGSNIHSYAINCGNGVIFQGKGKGQGYNSQNIHKTCVYTAPGIYTASCVVDNSTTPSCTKKVHIGYKPAPVKDDTQVRAVYRKYQNILQELQRISSEERTRGQGEITLPPILPVTGTLISQRIKTVHKSGITTSLDNNRYRLAGNTLNTDINFWKQVLPEQDRNADKYIVIPSNGMVMPINSIPSTNLDYNKIISGKEIKINSYLKTGSMEYPKTSVNGYGKVGNKVIFAHSSYLKKDDGRYKTDFQKIIELNTGEEIWIFERINHSYKMFKYRATASHETHNKDVAVLQPGIGKNLTLLTCTPIGGNEGRWVVKAKYIDEKQAQLQKQIAFNDVTLKHKILIGNFIEKLSRLQKLQKNNAIITIIDKIIQKEPSIRSQQTRSLLEFIKYKLAYSYFSH